MIIENTKTLFVHIPKSGGSSMTFMLLNQCGHKNSSTNLITNLPLDVKQRYHLRSREKHKTLYRYYENKNFDDYYKFCFIRNPWDKIVSAFKWFDYLETYNDFETFLDQYEDFFNQNTNPIEPDEYHCLSQHEFVMVDGVNKMTECFRYEDYPLVIDHLNKEKNWNLKMQYRKRSRGIGSPYDTKSIDRVAKMFEKDIEYFGFEYGKPATKNVIIM